MNADVSYRRYRRRILGWGAAALLIVFTVGAVVTTTRVEDDLEGRVVAELDDAGIGGVRVSFSGQDGVLTCASALEMPAAVAALDQVAAEATSLRGVRTIEVADGCRAVGSGPDNDADPTVETADPTVDASAAATTEPPSITAADPLPDQSIIDLIATDPRFSALDRAIDAIDLASLADVGPVTFFAPSNEAFEALTADEAGRLDADPELVAAILSQHVLTDAQMVDDLADGALETVGGSNVQVTRRGDDEVMLSSAGTTATITDADLVTTDGVVHVVDGLLVPARMRLEPVDPEVEAASRTAALQIDLDGIVAATRIGFAPGSTEVSFLSAPTLDRAAAAIVGRPGSTVIVRGHTDSGGTDLANLFASSARAEAVVEQLVLRGVPGSRLRAEGVGATEPVLVGDIEDNDASRRVDFLVEAAGTD